MDFAGGLAAWLRQCEHGSLFILFHGDFPPVNRTQPPALKIFADFQPQRGIGRLIQENTEALVGSGNGANERQLWRFDFLLPRWRRWPGDNRFGDRHGRRTP